jgi:hypothetical protein
MFWKYVLRYDCLGARLRPTNDPVQSSDRLVIIFGCECSSFYSIVVSSVSKGYPLSPISFDTVRSWKFERVQTALNDERSFSATRGDHRFTAESRQIRNDAIWITTK